MEPAREPQPDDPMHDKLDSASGTVAPTGSTPRTPIYRRRGIVASLLVSLIKSLFDTDGRRRRRTGRSSGNAPPLSDRLKRDIGLPIESPRSVAWNDLRW